MSYQAGAAKADITAFFEGVGMMGYGMFDQFAEGVETPLHARAIVIRDGVSGRKIALVNAEMCFITPAVKEAIMEQIAALGFNEQSVMLGAQHTHGGPGGYSHHALYNMSIPGFAPAVFEAVVGGIVEAITAADRQLRPVGIRSAAGEFPLDVNVAFNRSLAAYNRNPEVRPLPPERANEALDRRMLLFRFDGTDGLPVASWNFFGVHATSVSNDNRRITSDNKGHAAALMERDGVISAFAQRKAGDVTPNYIFDRLKGWTRGVFEDDHESARDHGRMQAELAEKLYHEAAGNDALPVKLDAVIAWFDFTGVEVAPEFSGGVPYARTSPACHGVAFAKGTREGPGLPAALCGIATILSRGRRAWELFSTRWMHPIDGARVRAKYRAQQPKDILIEAGECRILGFRDIGKLPIPGRADGALAAFKRFHANGSLRGQPWIPQVLPLQLIVLGRYVFAGIPGEVTTIAGQRIENMLLEILAPAGVTEVVAATYCNAYCGYITTPEEYDEQAYEGGHTVFGKHTLGAFLTRFRQLALELLKPAGERRDISDAAPERFTAEELALRSFDPAIRGHGSASIQTRPPSQPTR